jgi:hypothetical protein
VLPPVANADRAEPVPIYGYYDAFLDHEHQTFNGRPIASDSAIHNWARSTPIATPTGAS